MKHARRPGSGKPADDGRFSDLMRLAQDGDKAAYAQLLGEVTPLLRRAVGRRYGFLQPSDIDDLVQEVLLSVHVSRATYDPSRPFLPWLMAIARNRMIDGVRRSARRSANEVAVGRPLETFCDPDTNNPTTTYKDPEALRHAIHLLPEGQRRAVELLKLHELSLKEAAETSGMSIGALKVAMHRAMKMLRTVLSHEA